MSQGHVCPGSLPALNLEEKLIAAQRGVGFILLVLCFVPQKKLSPCNRRDCYAISNLGVFYFVFLSMFMFKTQIQRTFTFKIVVTSRQCFFKNHFKLYLKMEWHWFILIH